MGGRVVRIGMVLLLVGGIAWGVIHRDSLTPEVLEAWVGGFGAWGPIIFMLAYALAAVLFLPGSVLTVAGGALFGPLLGTIVNLTGATLGA
ncbi:MAG: TVP38/TMEM64 family protein, partial [Magnetococcales bacterium]|nr:TVP38/TMEM64 family protein [Magnetococcales bacterium]